MDEGKIIYPSAQKNAENDGVTPEMEQARRLGLLTPLEDSIDWLELKAENELKSNDGLEVPEKAKEDYILGKEKDDAGSLSDPHVRSNLESEFATDRGLVEVRRLSKINIAMAKEIADMMLGYDIELFRTPNFIKLTALREALIIAFHKDPEINDRMKAKERIREILGLEKQLSECLTVFGQEVQDIVSKQ